MKHAHNFVDLTGQKFGSLTVIEALGPQKGGFYYLCKCDCGANKAIRGSHLTSGKIKSCGCQHAALVSVARRKHGKTGTSVYVTWAGMNARCYCVTNHAYSDYGGRGITVCDRWRESFENFLADMGEPPSEQHTLDRIANDGPYSPENCKWSTKVEQAANRRSTQLVTFQGTTQSIAAWSRETGIGYGTLHMRLRILGWSAERALTTK